MKKQDYLIKFNNLIDELIENLKCCKSLITDDFSNAGDVMLLKSKSDMDRLHNFWLNNEMEAKDEN